MRLSLVLLAALTLVACGPPAGLHESCATKPCAAGQTCLSYFGIAGPSGPEFKTCEIPCKSNLDCPGGLRCAVVYDGPGQTCM